MWLKQQLQRSIISITYPMAGITIANLAEIKAWMEIVSLGIGIIGGLFGICSIIHHWNDRDKSDQ